MRFGMPKEYSYEDFKIGYRYIFKDNDVEFGYIELSKEKDYTEEPNEEPNIEYLPFN